MGHKWPTVKDILGWDSGDTHTQQGHNLLPGHQERHGTQIFKSKRQHGMGHKYSTVCDSIGYIFKCDKHIQEGQGTQIGPKMCLGHKCSVLQVTQLLRIVEVVFMIVG